MQLMMTCCLYCGVQGSVLVMLVAIVIIYFMRRIVGDNYD